MLAKIKEKQKAIKLRQGGYSYSEILKEVPVAKSTLSLWLRSVGLSVPQKQRLTEKKLAAMRRGSESRRNKKLERIKFIKRQAKGELSSISKRDLWMLGIALYWGEGAKEKQRSAQVALGNSDPYLIRLFLRWLFEICNISKSEICFRIFLHKKAEHKLYKVRKYWSHATGFPIREFNKVTWKKHNIKTIRKNVGDNYFGLLEIRVKRSTDLNRKIAGWTEAVAGK